MIEGNILDLAARASSLHQCYLSDERHPDAVGWMAEEMAARKALVRIQPRTGAEVAAQATSFHVLADCLTASVVPKNEMSNLLQVVRDWAARVAVVVAPQ